MNDDHMSALPRCTDRHTSISGSIPETVKMDEGGGQAYTDRPQRQTDRHRRAANAAYKRREKKEKK